MVLGTMYFGTRVEEQQAFALLDRFAEAGGGWLDTADNYSFWSDPRGMGGASERVLGAWLRSHPGAPVMVATKVRYDPLVPHRWPESATGLSAPAVRRAVEGSLTRLGIDQIDLLWAHGEDRSVPLPEVVAVFGELVDGGAAARVGAANHASWMVERARGLAQAAGVEPYSALQLRHSLVQPRPGAELPDAGHRLLSEDDLDLAQDAGLEVWAYTPLLNGGYARADRPFPPAYDHPGTARALEVLDEVVAQTGATRNQVVLAWLMSFGIRPIVGTSRLEQLDEALGAVELQLSRAQVAHLTAAR
jgi:aryl-alcohol dehydrogenase-like predicted oxidoreductase